MSMLRAFDYVFLLTGGEIEVPVYICFANANIESIVFAHEKDVPDSNVLYTEMQIIDKGLDGLGNDILWYVTNNPDDGEHFISFVSYKIHELLLNKIVTKNHVYTMKKIDTGGNIDLGTTNLIINERRY